MFYAKQKVPFALNDGKTLDEFEKNLVDIAKDEPVLLAQVTGMLSAKGITWVGAAAQGVRQTSLADVIKDARGVAYLVVKEKSLEHSYLERGRGFLFAAQGHPIKVPEDKFAGIRPLMREWLKGLEGAACIAQLMDKLNEHSISLIDLGYLPFAVQYRSYMSERCQRKTLPGEIKALLKNVEGLVIQGEPPRERCGLADRVEESYWSVPMRSEHSEASSENLVVIQPPVRCGGLRSEGWIDNLVQIPRRLAELSGVDRVDMTAVNKTIDAQKVNPSVYRYFDNSPACFQTADMKIFDTGLRFADDGESILVRFRRTTRTIWHGVDFVRAKDVALRACELKNADSLFCQAYMPRQEWIDDLKNAVNIQEEDWTIDDRNPDGVLEQYLRLTYYKLRQQGEVFVKPGVCQIFNTGLVNKSYNPIYAYLVPNDGGPQPWRYKCFGYPMDSTPNGRLISLHLDRDLRKPKWFDRIEDLYFDISRKVVPNYVHCMVENAMRLPRYLFRKAIIDEEVCDKTIRFLDELEAAISEERDISEIVSAYIDADDLTDEVDLNNPQSVVRAYFESLPDYDNILLELIGELDKAIAVSKRIIGSDYTAAVPMYYPRKGNFALLMPLAFHDPMKVECALVTELNKGGRYEGTTILTCPMAYADARLLRKPDAQWIVKHRA